MHIHSYTNFHLPDQNNLDNEFHHSSLHSDYLNSHYEKYDYTEISYKFLVEPQVSEHTMNKHHFDYTVLDLSMTFYNIYKEKERTQKELNKTI
jgi:hypothetical protein